MRHVLGIAFTVIALIVGPRSSSAFVEKPRPNFTGMYTGDPNQGRDEAVELPSQSSDAERARHKRPPPLPYTAEGKKRFDEYQLLRGPGEDNPAAYCASLGMPGMMEWVGNHPLEILHIPGRQLVMIFETNGETRRIYMGDHNIPPDYRFSTRHGYSEAHWDGDTLVIATDHLADSQDQFVRSHSDQAKTTERLSLSYAKDGHKIINYEMTLVDPVYYTQPIVWHRIWEENRTAVINEGSCNEDLWTDLLNARREQLKAGQPITATMADIMAARQDGRPWEAKPRKK